MIDRRSVFDDEPILTKPDAISGLKYSDYLNTLEWTDDLKSQLQEELVYQPHESVCTGDRRAVLYPEIRQVYVQEDVCTGVSNNISPNFVKTFLFTAFVLFVIMLNNL